MPLTAPDLFSLLDQVAEALSALPRRTLCAGERMGRGGHCFAEDRHLVDQVAAAIEARAPEAAAALRDGMDRADAYGALGAALSDLAARALDLQLIERSDAVAAAMDLVRLGRQRLAAAADARRPGLAEAAALGPAEAVLARRPRPAARRRPGPAVGTAAAAPGDSSALGALSPSPSPQRRAMRALRRAQAAALLDRLGP